MELAEHIEDIRRGIETGRFANEASISQGIVLRLLAALAWLTFDTRVVAPEYSLQGRRVDFALCHPAAKPIVFVEVKQVGQSEGSERQLFEYAFHTGVPIAILTDGREWEFFLPGEQGDYRERRVYKLDIMERDIAESVRRFRRYLAFEAFTSGQALKSAREDYGAVARQREIESTLPRAWAKLLEEDDSVLLELLADMVESLCGYKPDLDTTADFLRSHAKQGSMHPGIDSLGTRQRPRPQGGSSAKPIKDPMASMPVGFMIHGKTYRAKNAREVMTEFFRELSKRDATFLDRFAALPKHGRTRRYLSKNEKDLYPDSPHLLLDHKAEVVPGWWLGVNCSKSRILKIIEMACEVANLRIDEDVHVKLGD